MFNFNEWQVAGYVSIIIFVLWIISFIAAEIWKYVWAWIDDSKPEKRNFIINKLGSLVESKWKYPVYNCAERHAKDPSERGEIFGYAKDKKYNETSCHGLDEGCSKDYVYASSMMHKDTFNLSFKIIPITVLTPFWVLISIKFYTAGMVIGGLILTAYLSRFTRRLSKKFKIHSADKSIHLTPSEDK